MFITEREIEATTGYEVSRQNVNLAQMMIESFIGRTEEDIEDATDKSLLAQAVAFQAIYMEERPDSVLTQPEASYILQGGNATSYAPGTFAPFLSPWAKKACDQLSWKKSRSISTGKTFQSSPYDWAYGWTHDYV